MGELYNAFPKLPKNIRQIGDRDPLVKLYIEDYVNTYLKRLYPAGDACLRAGLILGNSEEYEGIPYIFIDGAIEIEDMISDGANIEFTDQSMKKTYQRMEELFPKRNICGWFLCGKHGTQLSPLNYLKLHTKYFAEKNMLMYLNSDLDGEEAVYMTSEDGFYKLRGHCIYYERNQMMQDYMVLRKDAKRVETGVKDQVIRDYRDRIDLRRSQAKSRNHMVGVLGSLCTIMSIGLIASGVVMFNNFEKLKQLQIVAANSIPVDSSYITQNNMKETEKQKPSKTPESEKIKEETETAAVKETAETTSEAETKPAHEEAKEDYTKYIVGDGETLYGICFKIYHSVNQIDRICEINGLGDQNHIMAGQTLLLPK